MKKLLSAFIMLTGLMGFAQITFEPGYFIDNTGTKTECLIKNLAWKNNPEQFEYKINETAETKIGTLKNVSEFNVSSYKFKRFDANVDLSSETLGSLSDVKEAEWQKKTLFFKILVEGKLNLYQYENDNKVKYFYNDSTTTQITQLLFKEYTIDTSIGENNTYKQQLYNLMKDKYTDIRKFESLKYKKDILVKLFADYDDTEAVKNYTKGQNKGSFTIKINLLASLASLSSQNDVSNANVSFNKEAVFGGGLELEYILPFNNNKWSVFTAPNVQFYSTSQTQTSNLWYAKKNWDVSYNFVELPIGARHYMFLNSNSKFFIDFSYIITFPVGTSTVGYNNNNLIEISKSSNAAIGAGYSYKKYSAALRYTFNRDITSNYVSWKTDYKSFGLILGYKIL